MQTGKDRAIREELQRQLDSLDLKVKQGIVPEREDIVEFLSGLERLEIAAEATTNYEYSYDL